MIYKILRQNIRPAQLFGFMCANLLGGFILLVGLQAYADFDLFMAHDESLIKGNQIVITKPVSSLNTFGSLLGMQQGFSPREVKALQEHESIREVGAFTSVHTHVRGAIQLGKMSMQTDMFLEAVPDAFVDVKVPSDNPYFKGWSASADDRCIPLILPRSYLNLYNYGYATTRGLPQLSEGLASNFPLRIQIEGGGRYHIYEARIVGFSNRINTILAPADFIAEINRRYAPNEDAQPSRLILATDASHDQQSLLAFLDRQGYVIEGDSDSLKIQTLAHSILFILAGVGLAISLLALYLLTLCITLITERNRERISNLLAIGYAPQTIARPYRLLVIALDLTSWVVSALLAFIGHSYMAGLLRRLSPDFEPEAPYPLILFTLLFIVLSLSAHSWLVGNRINHITNNHF